MGAENFLLLQPTMKGSREGIYHMRYSFIFEGIKKTLRIMIMPNYTGGVGISSHYRDEVTIVGNNTQALAKDIRFEINRLLSMWSLGKTNETLFKETIEQSYMCAGVQKTLESDDRNNRTDYYLSLYTEDNQDGPVVAVDVKSSLPSHLPRNTLVYLRDDGVYEVNASESAIAAHSGWADAVIIEILHLEKSKNE